MSSGFSKNGVSVSVTGATMMRIGIPAIGVNVSFDGDVFHIQLSYSRFSHNTEGQCGEWVPGTSGPQLPSTGGQRGGGRA